MFKFGSFSQSPGRFGATIFPILFNHYGIHATYEAFTAFTPEQAVLDINRFKLNGCAISQPLKMGILPFLTTRDSLVCATNSCNTILVSDGKLAGFNTDMNGALYALQGFDLSSCIIYGSGGVVGSVVTALKKLNARSISIVGRNSIRINHLIDHYALCHFEPNADYSVLINCTPSGRDNLSEELRSLLKQCNTIFDLNVSPQNTALVDLAIRSRKDVSPGYRMAVGQAKDQFKLYTGIDIPEDEILKIVEDRYLKKNNS